MKKERRQKIKKAKYDKITRSKTREIFCVPIINNLKSKDSGEEDDDKKILSSAQKSQKEDDKKNGGGMED